MDKISFAGLSKDILDLIKENNLFSSGNRAVDEFLFDDAIQMQEQKYVQTTVALRGSDVVGYYGLSTDALEVQSKEKDRFKRHHRWFPAIKLQWLGINSVNQSVGHGKILMRRIAGHIVEMNSYTKCDWAAGCRFITLDAQFDHAKSKDKKLNPVGFYEKIGFQFCDKMSYKERFLRYKNGANNGRGKGTVSMYYDVFDDSGALFEGFTRG
ncbi:hypothetical protein WDW37_19525 [Bdellovibrionota bacterium FG-1]